MAKKETEEKEEGVFDINDPILLENMILTQDVKHPVTGVSMLTRGNILTEKTITQLQNVAVKRVSAAPYAEESIAIAAGQVRDYFHSIEKIIGAKSLSVRNAAAIFRDMEGAKEFEQIVYNQMQNVLHYFNDHAVDSLVKLNAHHPDSAHHSIITGFNAMAIAKAMGWKEEAVLEASMATVTHDIGKVRVSLDTLDVSGEPDAKQREETQLHALFGGALLERGSLNNATMVALNHHEWYASVKGEGYGGLTLFRDMARKELDLDVDTYLAQASPQQLEITQICTVANEVASLEELRPEMAALSPFEVLLAMHKSARLGQFNPKIFSVWHKIYLRKNHRFMTKGLRVPLPPEKGQFIQHAGNAFIKLAATIRKLSLAELKQMELLPILKSYVFDLAAIEKDDGISIDRIERRGIEVHERKLENLGINPEKQVTVLLPAKEKRLTLEDMLGFGLADGKLADKKVANLLKRAKGSLTLPDLYQVGIQFSKKQLDSVGERLYVPISYELLVVKELGESRALFAVVREGDRLEELEKGNAYNSLDPLQSYLLNKIGLIELDFSDLTTEPPDLSGIVQGAHWQARKEKPAPS